MPTLKARLGSLDLLFSGFFFISGFCSLVYEVVWLRLAMAGFGVNAALISIFLACFMGGLGLGVWTAGRWTRGSDSVRTWLRRYAGAELWAACGALTAPSILNWGRLTLVASGTAWSSSEYFAASGLWIAAAVLPFALAMGA